MTEDFRKSAPEPLASVSFDIPKPVETTLSNGLKIVVVENDRLPLVNFRLAFLTGESAEPQDSIGTASALTSMLNEGTRNYTSKQLAEEVERLGASISASSSSDFMLVSASGLSLYTDDILRLVAELVLYPTFPESELNLYKQNTLENLKFQRSQPDFLANEQMARILYGEHPYSVVSPSPSDITGLSKSKLHEFHQKVFIPNNAILIAVGDVDTAEFTAKIEDFFSGWKQGTVESLEIPEIPEQNETTLTIVDRAGSAQSNIILGNIAIERTNPDYFPVLLMNQVLGAGASSRIFMNLREEKGYTYGAYSRIDTKKLAGEFEATAEVRTAVTGESIEEFLYEINRIRDEKVSDDELLDAKNFLAGVFPIRAETLEGLTNLIVSQKLYGLPDDYLETYRANVNAVTPDEVQKAANKYIHPEQLAIVIVGDGREVLAAAKKFAGRIEIYDTEGNTKEMEEYEINASAEPADLSGNWSLNLTFQGQQFPVTLSIEQDGENVSGNLESMLGSGSINDGNVRGNSFTALAQTDFQGQTLELNLNGSVAEDKMTGTISTPMIPAPIEFSGERDK